MMETRSLSVDEIVVYLGIGRENIFSRVEKWDLPAIHIGRVRKFQQNDIGNWIKYDKVADRNNEI